MHQDKYYTLSEDLKLYYDIIFDNQPISPVEAHRLYKQKGEGDLLLQLRGMDLVCFLRSLVKPPMLRTICKNEYDLIKSMQELSNQIEENLDKKFTRGRTRLLSAIKSLLDHSIFSETEIGTSRLKTKEHQKT